jgi:hypothetical protein
MEDPIKDSSKRMLKQTMNNPGNETISFNLARACYPFTIEGEEFSLLCCQPQAFPPSLTTMVLWITPVAHC